MAVGDRGVRGGRSRPGTPSCLRRLKGGGVSIAAGYARGVVGLLACAADRHVVMVGGVRVGDAVCVPADLACALVVF